MGFKDIIEWPGKFLANGGHAQQDIPSQHRLLNAGGMFFGWLALDNIRQVVFGVKMKSEGEYVEVPIEDVSAPLKFLHKAIKWDPHSETPENQWKKLTYQLFPGVGAGVGAVLGSMYAFERNGRAQTFKANELKGLNKLNLLDLDFQAQYAQSKSLRILSGFFGTFSAASGLTFMYGMFLNPAFASANGAKVFAGSLAKGNMAPHKAVEAELGMIGTHIQEALKTGKLSDKWAKEFELRVLEPMFGHELKTPEAQAKAVQTIQDIVEKSYNQFKANGKPAKEIAEAVSKDISAKLGKGGIEKTLKESFGLDPKKAIVGNANPIIRSWQDFMGSVGLSKPITPTGKANAVGSGGYALPLLGGTALGATAVGLMSAHPAKTSNTLPAITPVSNNGETQNSATPNTAITKHATPDATGKTVAEYVLDATALHNQQYAGNAPPKFLKWMGDAQLAVLPTNRMFCAIGLTAGQIIGGNMAKIATGIAIDGKALDASKVPTYLQWMKGIVKDYNPKGLRPRDRWISYAQWGVFSLGGLMGVKIGTDLAYRNVAMKNKDPHYLEDYLPRVSMHQGKNWSWLAAFSANFGSASGLWTLPIPGLNYGIGLAGRATSMQDRNFMLPVLNEYMSGASTTSFMRLREGMNYLCHYAVNNPAEDPTQIEFLAYTMLGPIFKDKLTTEHIQKFTAAVHEVRDRYWQEGGIPADKKKEAMKTMREVFTGAGLEVLLIDLGLNPGTIAFDKLNGMTGTIGNIGIHDKIMAEQTKYHKDFIGRLEKYVSEGLIEQSQADWAKAGVEAMQQGKKPPTEIVAPAIEPEKTIEAAEAPAQQPFAERMNKPTNRLKDLLDKSEAPGDWRKKAHLPDDQRAPAAVGG